MSESLCIDSPFRGLAMPKSYSGDLRERVIEAVEVEGMSRREAAERFDISASSSIRWVERWNESRSAAPKPRGGSVSPLEEHAERLKRRIETSRSALSRFFGRHGITFKKKPASRGTAASGRGARAPTLDPRARHA